MKKIIKQVASEVYMIVDCDNCNNYHFYAKSFDRWIYLRSEPKCIWLSDKQTMEYVDYETGNSPTEVSSATGDTGELSSSEGTDL